CPVTVRVFDCQRPAAHELAPPPHLREPRSRSAAGLSITLVLAAVIVPLAGAAEPRDGLLVATLAAATVLLLAICFGRCVPWAWVTVVCASAGLAMPRGQQPVIGPALFVATTLSVVLWLA